MQVEPQTPLPAVYHITDHTDAARDSYYVRAIMRDSLTGDTLQTLNLTSEGEGRYAGSLPAPVDGSGLGRQVDITTTVYTDAGYTTKSDLYQQTIEKWYVKSAPMSYGGSGGEDFDYKLIRTIFKEELSRTLTKALAEHSNEIDLEPILLRFNDVLSAVAGIEFPEMPEIPQPEVLDLGPVLRGLERLAQTVVARIDELPEPEKPNLDPLLRAIRNFESILIRQEKVVPEVVDRAIEVLAKQIVAGEGKGTTVLVLDRPAAPNASSEQKKSPVFDRLFRSPNQTKP